MVNLESRRGPVKEEGIGRSRTQGSASKPKKKRETRGKIYLKKHVEDEKNYSRSLG